MAIETISKIDAAAEAERVAKLYQEQGASSSTGVGETYQDINSMFQKLLIAQLKTQDPLDPVDNKDLVNQLSSLNSLQYLSSINDKLGKTDTLANATPLIGKLVSGLDSDSKAVGGLVSSVTVENNQVYLNIGDNKLTPSQVKQVMNYYPSSTGS